MCRFSANVWRGPKRRCSKNTEELVHDLAEALRTWYPKEADRIAAAEPEITAAVRRAGRAEEVKQKVSLVVARAEAIARERLSARHLWWHVAEGQGTERTGSPPYKLSGGPAVDPDLSSRPCVGPWGRWPERSSRSATSGWRASRTSTCGGREPNRAIPRAPIPVRRPTITVYFRPCPRSFSGHRSVRPAPRRSAERARRNPKDRGRAKGGSGQARPGPAGAREECGSARRRDGAPAE